MLDLNLMRQQLRVDPDELSDELLEKYEQAAIRWVENRTNRVLFAAESPDAALPDGAPANALRLDGSIHMAIMLLVAHWDSNRDASTEVALTSAPFGVASLVEPYRWWYD